jgi:hypothetical protein
MKKLLYVTRIVTFLLFFVTAFFAILELTGPSGLIQKLNHPKPAFSRQEAFDPTLQRLNNIEKLQIYCDSIYEERQHSPNYSQGEREYAQIAAEVGRERFYHGLSSFGFGDNYLGYLANPSYIGYYLNAPVGSNDILKFSYGICSQQATVLMDLLKIKGYQIRKVGFYSNAISGHFCYEAFYDGNWHFYDPDLEPDMTVLNAYNRPDIKYLVEHRDVLKQAYNKMDPVKVDALFPTYFYGKVNEHLAANATIFQVTTKILSYSIWIFFLLAFFWVNRKYVRLSKHQYVRNRRVSLSTLQPG